jgi:hypothetical protein
MALMAAALAVGAGHVTGLGDAAAAAGALLVAYVLADLGTGIYHWGVDNYGDGSTPVFGRQIAAFQGHHQRPWTITQREFCNNLHQARGGVTARALFGRRGGLSLTWSTLRDSASWQSAGGGKACAAPPALTCPRRCPHCRCSSPRRCRRRPSWR